MKGLVALGLVAVVVLGLVFWGIQVNNDLTRKDVLVDEAWSQVENVYQRRLDLVPNLVNTVKGAAEFQQETFTAVTEARAKASSIVVTPEMLNDPAALQRFQQAQSELSGALSRLLATVENYPQLTATEGFRDLMVQLEGTENRIATERRRFNEVVREYNTAVRRVPGSLVASLRGFRERPFFEATPGSQTPPPVKF
jgi:LemA protein